MRIARFFNAYTNHITVLMLIGLVGMFYFFPRGEMYYTLMRSEIGIVENLTVLFCLVSMVLSIYCYKISKNLPSTGLFKAFFVFFALGSFVLAGEEASWGQHYFGWEATGYLAEHNVQKETNFHNLGNGYEQVPKILLHLAALVAMVWVGIVKFKNIQLDTKKMWYWLMPTSITFLPALVGIATRVWERSYVWRGIPDWDLSGGKYIGAFKELKEVNETFLLLFCVAYLASVLVRYHQQK